ncbi:hypothetical protein BV360_02223 [Pseudomonas syringae pv. actinidiae]|nr:nucleic acid ATP-dependent helicase [Pseudomonas syringae pv. actinidiae ICMP 18884]AOE54503.1 nucleic acid ATP-dependent helicase [Pseudomonas syringae pv. actinidiae ICMP 18708]APP95368.1 nucleic acid ATP-dependent helicase [Pseudomonas syringae pv. actinidiae]EPM87380.1 nucleic acid ATP-dependent helicase [Pseudomonas syringae pv. actinidiae ICMP 18886]EPN57468.1 nucleic acid ATP-dependent helicase [Pseudomonas syringae pv. actinidiae ICMP 19079]EPN72632.1 nucleic acid ATP-dependent heli
MSLLSEVGWYKAIFANVLQVADGFIGPVHRTELLRQWQERLQAFLGVGKVSLVLLGAEKRSLQASSTLP